MASSSSVRIIWLDQMLHNDINKEFLEDIRNIDREAMLFTDFDECVQYLRRGLPSSQRFIFIVSGNLGEKLVPQIQDSENIVSIYVYCSHISKHEGWSRQYEKVGYSLDYFCFVYVYYQNRSQFLLRLKRY